MCERIRYVFAVLLYIMRAVVFDYLSAVLFRMFAVTFDHPVCCDFIPPLPCFVCCVLLLPVLPCYLSMRDNGHNSANRGDLADEAIRGRCMQGRFCYLFSRSDLSVPGWSKSQSVLSLFAGYATAPVCRWYPCLLQCPWERQQRFSLCPVTCLPMDLSACCTACSPTDSLPVRLFPSNYASVLCPERGWAFAASSLCILNYYFFFAVLRASAVARVCAHSGGGGIPFHLDLYGQDCFSEPRTGWVRWINVLDCYGLMFCTYF